MPDPNWYLLKHEDAKVFGPVPFALLDEWARAAQISPLDKVSTDGTNWMRAPMLPELRMDWLVQINAQQCYGPTTLETVREFLEHGEIDEDTELINACDGTVHRVRDSAFFTAPVGVEGAGEATSPADLEDDPVALRQRVQSLEEALAAARISLAELHARYAELAAKHTALSARSDPTAG